MLSQESTLAMTTEQQMVESGILSSDMLDFLRMVIRGAANILISGSPESDRIALMRCLVQYIPEHERIIAFEKDGEAGLKTQYPHKAIVSFSLDNFDGANEENHLVRLLKNTFKLLPDRIVVESIYYDAAATFLMHAMNTGHACIGTIHGWSLTNAIHHFVAMASNSDAQTPIEHIWEYVISNIDIAVHVRQLPDERRVVEEVAEVVDYQDGKLVVSPIFKYRCVTGEHIRTKDGYISQELAQKLMWRGVKCEEIRPWTK